MLQKEAALYQMEVSRRPAERDAIQLEKQLLSALVERLKVEEKATSQTADIDSLHMTSSELDSLRSEVDSLHRASSELEPLRNELKSLQKATSDFGSLRKENASFREVSEWFRITSESLSIQVKTIASKTRTLEEQPQSKNGELRDKESWVQSLYAEIMALQPSISEESSIASTQVVKAR